MTGCSDGGTRWSIMRDGPIGKERWFVKRGQLCKKLQKFVEGLTSTVTWCQSTRDDMKQEAAVTILGVEIRYRSLSLVTMTKIAKRAVRNRIVDLIRRRQAEDRRRHTMAHRSQHYSCFTQQVEAVDELRTIEGRLNPGDQEFIDYMKRGLSVMEAGTVMGQSRSAAYRSWGRIREAGSALDTEEEES